jgi:uncharacterized membrane protein YedE/YeeE
VCIAFVSLYGCVFMRKSYWLAIALIIAALGTAYLIVPRPEGRTLSFCLLIGLALGFVLQRSRFCFLCHARDWFDKRDARGLLSIVLAIAVGSVIYQIILASWLPVPERLPPDMHIGPVSIALLAAGIAFGIGMVISGSCISAHLYRLGEGSPVAPFALIGTGLGFLLGFNTWNPLFSLTIAESPVIWLPQQFGYAGALLLQLAALAAIALWLWRKPLPPRETSTPVTTLKDGISRLFTGRWPYWTGGIAIGLLSALVIIRTKPLGVTSAIGSLAREVGEQYQLVPIRLDGLDTFGGCATIIKVTLLTPNGILISALVIGSFAAALLSRQFTPRLPTFNDAGRGLIGGTLLGWGSMTGIGCTIGNLLSGTMAGALSGWVFGIGIFIALWAGFAIQRRLAKTSSYTS